MCVCACGEEAWVKNILIFYSVGKHKALLLKEQVDVTKKLDTKESHNHCKCLVIVPMRPQFIRPVEYTKTITMSMLGLQHLQVSGVHVIMTVPNAAWFLTLLDVYKKFL